VQNYHALETEAAHRRAEWQRAVATAARRPRPGRGTAGGSGRPGSSCACVPAPGRGLLRPSRPITAAAGSRAPNSVKEVLPLEIDQSLVQPRRTRHQPGSRFGSAVARAMSARTGGSCLDPPRLDTQRAAVRHRPRCARISPQPVLWPLSAKL
jgi:hypothetical protein